MTPPLYAILITNIPYKPPMDLGILVPNIPPAANKAVREQTCTWNTMKNKDYLTATMTWMMHLKHKSLIPSKTPTSVK
jgi:hypothetical protein